MKRLLPIFFLGIFLAYSLGQLAVFYSLQQTQKTNFKHYALIHHAKQLKRISFSPSQLYINQATIKWLDGNKEIEINGKRHDIVSKSSQNGITTFFILEDTKENNLISEFHQHQKDNSQLKWLKTLSTLVFQQHEKITTNISTPNFNLNSSFITIETFQLSDFTSNLIKPPTA